MRRETENSAGKDDVARRNASILFDRLFKRDNMLEERTAIERWARSQLTRIEALRDALRRLDKEDCEGYLIPQLLMPYFYFEGTRKQQQQVQLRTREFMERTEFKQMMQELKRLGFTYVGDGTFEGVACDGVDDIIEDYGLLRVAKKIAAGGSRVDGIVK